MAANQVVLYFDRQEDALRFTLAASSVMSAEGALNHNRAAIQAAEGLCRATRITAEGALNNLGKGE